MAESQINEPDTDKDNNPHTPETQALDTALSRLITVARDFTQAHAVQAFSEIKTLWPDLQKTEFTAYEVYNLAQVLRQAKVSVETRCLRAFLVAWKVLDVNFPSLDVTGQAKLIRDMVVCQLGAVEKGVMAGDDKKTVGTPRTKTGADLQTLSPGSPFKLLFKTHKRWARQRQLKSLISQTKKPEKRKREEEPENDGTAIHEHDDEYNQELNMSPVTVSAAEKEALTRQKLERKRKLEALALKQKKCRYI
ncbi:hypothetical protein E4T52_14979 [Aureobasidium sp. EXF-3400]|nr:hypothetical protein E4T51_14009 [Aureobasidium sp. EXF-12344]KAI4769975.1 hypothetical protein E4T52_14979 [Aureobasidium sp. EXF-3400]